MSGPFRFLAFRRVWVAALLPAVFGASFFSAIRWYEFAVTFHPDPYTPGQEWKLPKGGEEVSFLNADRLRLHGWFISSQPQPSRATVIFFHGNGGNISNVGWLGEYLAGRGFDVLLFDYRGYGKSEGRIKGERDLYSDADAAYDYVVSKRGVSPERLVLYGHSLGTTAVVDLASRRPCSAIIVESGLSSADEMASSMLPWLPRWMHGLGENRFESAKKLISVHSPVLIMHGDPDSVVPTEQGIALFAAANEPKRLIIAEGAGHIVSGFDGFKYIDAVAEFIQESLRVAN